jgi:pimeloyl-ACP methyl ester carboxylesterase/DNA-binding winged helix-turn-helix (wHTH) protein
VVEDAVTFGAWSQIAAAANLRHDPGMAAGRCFRFDGFVLDVDRRELRFGDELRPLQPQVFDLLVYLVTHRERVVAKIELLDELWKGAVVTDASLQRAVSLARQALARPGGPDLIETHARRGYRFAGNAETRRDVPATVDSTQWPRPSYVETADGVHLAWRVLEAAGDQRREARPDIVVVSGWSLPMEAWATHPRASAILGELRALGRVVLFDRRGVGLSDRVKTAASLEQRALDLDAVLDAARTARAVLVGFSEGAPLSLFHAAQRPERVHGLVLVGAFSKMIGEHGFSEERLAALREYIRHAWGGGATVTAIFPDHAGDRELARWAAEVERLGASPGAALDLLEMNLTVDAGPFLGAIRAPAVVLHHREDRVVDVENGRQLARRLSRVRYIEVSGTDHTFLLDDRDVLVEALRSLLCAP